MLAAISAIFFCLIFLINVEIALISPTAKLLDEPSPVEPGISENVEISIGKLILKYFKTSRTIGLLILLTEFLNSTSLQLILNYNLENLLVFLL